MDCSNLRIKGIVDEKSFKLIKKSPFNLILLKSFKYIFGLNPNNIKIWL